MPRRVPPAMPPRSPPPCCAEGPCVGWATPLCCWRFYFAFDVDRDAAPRSRAPLRTQLASSSSVRDRRLKRPAMKRTISGLSGHSPFEAHGHLPRGGSLLLYPDVHMYICMHYYVPAADCSINCNWSCFFHCTQSSFPSCVLVCGELEAFRA